MEKIIIKISEDETEGMGVLTVEGEGAKNFLNRRPIVSLTHENGMRQEFAVNKERNFFAIPKNKTVKKITVEFL
ncbi:MAG: hypothetical protein WC414_00265 [Patescibacteria group bacterium]